MSNGHPERERILEMAARGEAPIPDLELSIARTRADLDLHLKAVESRLSREELIAQTMSYLKLGPGEYFANLGHTVKANPIPVALLTLSAAWLLFANQRGGRVSLAAGGEASETVGSAASRAGDRIAAGLGQASESVGSAASYAEDRIGSGAEAVRQRAAELAEGVGVAASHIGGRAQRTVERARAGAGQVGSAVREQARRVHSGYQNMVNEHPLVLGLLAFAVGAAVAASLPRTRREDELMGEASDRLAGTVEARAQESAEVVAEKAEEALGRAKETILAAEPQNVSPRADPSKDGGAAAHVTSELAAEGAARP
jgi:hypothetical protein